MADSDQAAPLEREIEAWRNHIRRRHHGAALELARRETQLRAELNALTQTGLAADEACLIALKRIARDDDATREFARARSEQIWKRFGDETREARRGRAWSGTDAFVAFAFAVLAAIAVKLPALFGIDPRQNANEAFYLRNASFFVLPALIAYFVWKRRLSRSTVGWLAGAFVLAGLVANLAAFGRAEGFVALTALHLPIALWLAVGIAYTGGRWSQPGSRMDFIRFSGELFIYYVLIALGGGVLCAFMAVTFDSIGIDIEPFFESWLLPCGAAGAVIVAAWLVETKQAEIENIAPMLTRLFTPLFAAMLIAFLATLLWSGRGIDIARNVLIAFDLLLVVVLGLLVYSISARDPSAPPGAFDFMQVALVISALIADGVALWAIGARISEFGPTPNRVAALGENLILLVNLAGSAVLYLRFLLGRGSFTRLERWQTSYVPVYAGWAAVVVIVFPPLFRWIA